MQKVMITGASSYVGARIFVDLKDKYITTGTYHRTKLSDQLVHLDTTDQQEVKELVQKVQPNTIVHVAANASAKWCEDHPDEARALNEEATRSVVGAAQAVGADVVFISSFAALDTSNIYGQTKAASEQAVKKADRWTILRPSLVIGFSPNTTNDRPFNRILKNIDEGTPAVYDTSWKFQPTYLGHISEVITLVIDKKINTETIPVAVSSLKSRFDIAKDILTEFNIPVIPENKQDKTPVIEDDLRKLKELGMPIYEYDQMIRVIVEEIRNRDNSKF